MATGGAGERGAETEVWRHREEFRGFGSGRRKDQEPTAEGERPGLEGGGGDRGAVPRREQRPRTGAAWRGRRALIPPEETLPLPLLPKFREGNSSGVPGK